MKHYVLPICVVAGFCVLFCAAGFVPYDAALNLAVGWFLILAGEPPTTGEVRTYGSVVVAGSAAAVALVASLSGRLLLIRPVTAIGDTRSILRSRNVGAIVIVLASAIGAMGTIHIFQQVGLCVRSPEPLTELTDREVDRLSSANNLSVIGTAARNASNPQQFAIGVFDAAGKPMHGWQTLLLPHLDYKFVYDMIDLSVPWDDPANSVPFGTSLPLFLNPGLTNPERDANRESDIDFQESHYAGNSRLAAKAREVDLAGIPDGGSQTLLMGEIDENRPHWGKPMNFRDPALGIDKAPDGFGSPFELGAYFLFCDGGVGRINRNIDRRVLEALATPDGGEPVQSK